MIGSGLGRAVLAALSLGLLAGGCGGGQDDEVRSVVEDFYTALADGDAAAACGLLSPAARSELERSSGTPCEQALPEELPAAPTGAVGVRRFGDAAKADLGSESAFLARYDKGWRIIAAGCTPHREHPYECSVKGG